MLHTLGSLCSRYLAEVTPRKRSADSERLRLQKMSKAPLFALNLAELNSTGVAAYRDSRLETVRPGTVARELSLIHNILDTARDEWGIDQPPNPVRIVKRPKIRNARDRDVLPKAPRLISRVRGCQDALTGGFAQRAWQHRRASARLSRYAVAHGCSRGASRSAPSGHGSTTRTASRSGIRRASDH